MSLRRIFAVALFFSSACAATHGGFGNSDAGPGTPDAMASDAAPPTTCAGGCGANETCIDGACCALAKTCGDICCGNAQVCSFGACVNVGAPCSDSTDCAPNEYCDNDVPGADAGSDAGSCQGSALGGRCVPRPPYCGSGDGGTDAGAGTCIDHCEAHPAASALSPQLAYAWGGQITSPWESDVMMTPLVVQLDDDDCDGKITSHDIPEIVFTTFSNGWYLSPSSIHAISIIKGKVVEKWQSDAKFAPIFQLAAGNIDGKPGNEIVGCTRSNTVMAINGFDGSFLWESPQAFCEMPMIADLDQDGSPEVIVEGGILDGKTGAMKHGFSTPMSTHFVVSDLDGDGFLDVITANQAYDRNGVLFASTAPNVITNGAGYGGADWYAAFPAIGDFDLDGKPEVVAMDDIVHQVSIWTYDATASGHTRFVRTHVDINGSLSTSLCPNGTVGTTSGGGPPTVADFDGDGTPDIGIAGGVGYAVFDGKKIMDGNVTNSATMMWQQKTHDCSSATTGSSVFDFNGDGAAEVIYGDEHQLYVFDGKTGTPLWTTCNTNGTGSENPIVADVDGDGHADLVAVSNSYAASVGFTCNNTSQSGVRVFSSATVPWVHTRAIWNEHPYHVTNVEDDGTIPTIEKPNWTQPGLNNFRMNKQPGSEFYAPDAVASIATTCQGGYALTAGVSNHGEGPLPPVEVSFYAKTSNGTIALGTSATTHTLQPLQTEFVTLNIQNAPAEVTSGKATVFAVVDDKGAPHPTWTECRTDNNRSPDSSSACPVN
jgi:hypothetical protein